MNATHDVFLSHSSLDDELAEDVRMLLTKSDISVFSTPTSIPSGKWEQQIEDALKQSTDVWVLLTPNALAESIWVHQELAYFYGFHHGRGEDDLGRHSRYMYQPGTVRPGLYDHLQGTDIERLGDPVFVAKAIADSLGKPLTIPDDWHNPSYDIDQGRLTVAERFNEQLSSIGSQLIARIRSGGHWQIVIRPLTFDEKRLPYDSLRSAVQKGHVRHAGWDFPSMDAHSVIRGDDWVGEEFEGGESNEAWRLYESGQFVHLYEFPSDIDSDYLDTLDPSQIFNMNSCVNHLTMVFEFAAGLSQSEAGDETMFVRTDAFGLEGRILASPKRLWKDLQTHAASFSDERTVTREEWSTKARDLPIEIAANLLQRFGYGAVDHLRSIQNHLLQS